jgi:AcrR family transcriptional regulator
MEAHTATAQTLPKRADARRNYERVLAAAREAFAEGGESTSLEEIARRAGVGIGTLYRHFPSRQALLEALYVNEVEEISRSAAEIDDPDPWRALNVWLQRLTGYLATKRALANELMNYLDADAELFRECRTALFAAGEPLLKRAQDAGAVRPDVEFWDVLHMVAGITRMPSTDPGQNEHILRVALDGLRYQPQS